MPRDAFVLNIKRELCHPKRTRKGSGLSRNGPQGPVSRKFRELFGSGSEKPVFKLQSACFEKLISEFVSNVRKTKRTAKFDGFEHRRCEDMKGIVVPEIGLKSFGTFEKQALVISCP